MTDQTPGTLPRALWWAALAVSLLLIGVGLDRHWNVALPIAGIGRFLSWLAAGVFSAVPVFVIGAVTVRSRGRRIFELDRIIATAVCWAAGWVVIVAIGLATLAAGCYSPLFWQIAAPAAWLFLLGWMVATRWDTLRSLAESFRRAPGEPIRLVSWRALLMAVGAAAAVDASLPPDTRDELSYHLVMPELWAGQSNWWLPLDNFHLAFPGNGELMWGWASAVSGPLAPRFITLAFALLTMALLDGWMAGQQTPRWIRDLSLAFLAVTPLALTAASICYVEWPLLFFLILGWRLSRLSLTEQPAATLGWAVACWGVAAGIKYTAPLFIGLLALQWFSDLARGRATKALVAGCALAASVTVLAGPWYVRNWMATGDPIFPLGGAVGLVTDSPHDSAVLSQYADLQGGWRWFPMALPRDRRHRRRPPTPPALADASSGGPVHRLAVATRPAVVCRAGLDRRPRLVQSGTPIYLPLMLLAWLFLPRILEELPGTGADRRLVSLSVGLMAAVSLPIALHFMFAPGGRAVPDYLLGATQKESYLVDRGLVGPTTEWVVRHTSPDARIWAWCEDRTLYLERWARSDSPYGPPTFLVIVEDGGAASLDVELTRSAVDYVLLRRDRCPESWKTATFEKRSWEIDPDVGNELTTWSQTRLEELIRDDRHILYRVRR